MYTYLSIELHNHNTLYIKVHYYIYYIICNVKCRVLLIVLSILHSTIFRALEHLSLLRNGESGM